mgnify:FL=1
MNSIHQPRQGGIRRFVIDNITLFILLGIILIGAIFTDSFFTRGNVLNVLRQVSLNGVLAAGFTMVLLADGFDLSMGAIVSACGVVAVGMLNSTRSPVVAVFSALVLGAVFGLCNGFLIRLIKGDGSDSYLVTLGTSLLATGVAYTYSGGYIMYPASDLTQLKQLAKGSVFGVPNLVIIMLVVMLVLQFVLKRTQFGRSFYMVGSNKVAAYYSGINTHRIKTMSFVISGLCAGLGALMMVFRAGGGGPASGTGYEFNAAIATIIGGNREGRASTSMVKTLIGVLIFGLVSNIMNLMNCESTLQKVIQGVILFIALFSDSFRKE